MKAFFSNISFILISSGSGRFIRPVFISQIGSRSVSIRHVPFLLFLIAGNPRICTQFFNSSRVNPSFSNSSYRVQLWDLGIDWNKLSDFSLFCMLAPTLSKDSTKLLFNDLDFQKFQVFLP